MKKKVYISGPITGHDINKVRSNFTWMECMLQGDGYDTVNPLNNGVPENATWVDHMRADIKLLVDCDAIFMLDGWRDSQGAKTELDVALGLGMEIMYESTHIWP